MKFYQDLGFLILGSRLRRISEYYLSEINKVYQTKGITFDASWFPVFYILSKNEAVSLKEIACLLGVSHSAVSQLIKVLKSKKLVETKLSSKDKRHQLVSLTNEGIVLLKTLQPIWKSIAHSLKKIEKEAPEVKHLMPSLLGLEAYFQENPFSTTILKHIK